MHFLEVLREQALETHPAGAEVPSSVGNGCVDGRIGDAHSRLPDGCAQLSRVRSDREVGVDMLSHRIDLPSGGRTAIGGARVRRTKGELTILRHRDGRPL
jgi:hypothetical protein